MTQSCKLQIGLVTFFLSSVLDNLTSTIVMVSLLRKLVPPSEFRKYELTITLFYLMWFKSSWVLHLISLLSRIEFQQFIQTKIFTTVLQVWVLLYHPQKLYEIRVFNLELWFSNVAFSKLFSWECISGIYVNGGSLNSVHFQGGAVLFVYFTYSIKKRGGLNQEI